MNRLLLINYEKHHYFLFCFTFTGDALATSTILCLLSRLHVLPLNRCGNPGKRRFRHRLHLGKSSLSSQENQTMQTIGCWTAFNPAGHRASPTLSQIAFLSNYCHYSHHGHQNLSKPYHLSSNVFFQSQTPDRMTRIYCIHGYRLPKSFLKHQFCASAKVAVGDLVMHLLRAAKRVLKDPMPT